MIDKTERSKLKIQIATLKDENAKLKEANAAMLEALEFWNNIDAEDLASWKTQEKIATKKTINAIALANKVKNE